MSIPAVILLVAFLFAVMKWGVKATVLGTIVLVAFMYAMGYILTHLAALLAALGG